ncbi:MAG TPA: hypothetical protein VF328_08070, partial [Mycobacterium sp.]
MDLVQHGLSGDAKCRGGLVEAEPAVGCLGSDPITQGLVDADAPGCAGGDLLGGDESFADPAVQGGPGDTEDLFGGGDGDHDDIVAVGPDIGCRRLVDRDVVASAQDRHPCSGEGQAGGGAAFLFGQDRGDGAVVVVLGQAAHQGHGCLVGHAQMLAGLGHRHRQVGGGATLPQDPQFREAFFGAHGDGDFVDHCADELFAFPQCGGGGVEHRPHVRAGGGDPGQFLFGQRHRAPGALGGQVVLRGADRGQLGFQRGLQCPCHQTVLRFDVVELTLRAVGFVAGPFGRQLEHR